MPAGFEPHQQSDCWTGTTKYSYHFFWDAPTLFSCWALDRVIYHLVLLPQGWLRNLSCGPLLSRAGGYPSVHSMQPWQLPRAPSLKRWARSTCARLLVQMFWLLQTCRIIHTTNRTHRDSSPTTHNIYIYNWYAWPTIIRVLEQNRGTNRAHDVGQAFAC